jgi:hypothetical protein
MCACPIIRNGEINRGHAADCLRNQGLEVLEPGAEWNGSIPLSWDDSDPVYGSEKSRNGMIPFSIRFWNRITERNSLNMIFS